MIPPLTLRVLRAYIRHAPGHLGKPWLAGHLNTLLKEHPLTTTARTGSGMVFPVATSDVIQRYLYLFGVWEPHLTAFISGRLTPKDTFVDVGANIGYYSVLASRLVGPAGHVVAVEPSPTSIKRWSRTRRATAVATSVRSTPPSPTALGG